MSKKIGNKGEKVEFYSKLTKDNIGEIQKSIESEDITEQLDNIVSMIKHRKKLIKIADRSG